MNTDTNGETSSNADAAIAGTDRLALPFWVDMTTVFENAEAMQKQVGIMACGEVRNGMSALYALTVPAVELALATLAECAGTPPLPDADIKEAGAMPSSA